MRMLYSNNQEQPRKVFVPVILTPHHIVIDGALFKLDIPRRDITMVQQTGIIRKTITVVAGPTRHYFNVSGDQAREIISWWRN